jgi:hypothetical protein|tara:strand:- start:970 stop:1173 length:204 start_codon:yes stop_codon:yes gene_type:complete
MGRKLGKKARKKLIIENLKHTIEMGGNPINIAKLKEILESVENDTFVSQYKRRAKRKPLKKKDKKDS